MSVVEYCDNCGDETDGAQVLCKTCGRGDAPNRMRGWLEREKALGRLTPGEVQLVERCIEDLR